MAELADTLAPAFTEASCSLQAEYGIGIEVLAEQIVRDSLPRCKFALKPRSDCKAVQTATDKKRCHSHLTMAPIRCETIQLSGLALLLRAAVA
jgi:hypothetical protein